MNNTLTPDGVYYAQMGLGQRVPRPYSLRTLARWMPNDYEAWETLQFVSLAIAFSCICAITHIVTHSWIAPFFAALTFVTLPAVRRAERWPVLLDAPMWAASTLVTLACLVNPYAGAVVALASLIVHERAFFYGLGGYMALGIKTASWGWEVPFLGIVALVCAAITVMRYTLHPKPTDQDPEWLRMTTYDFLRRHWADRWKWRSWVLPLASLWLIIPCFTWNVGIALAMCYLPLAFAHDRNRIIASGAIPLCILTCLELPQNVCMFLPLVNMLIDWREP